MARLPLRATTLVLLLLALAAGLATASDDRVHSAPVVVDGHVLLQVRGIAAVPADSRADSISDALIEAADNPEIDPDDASLVTRDDGGVELRFGGQRVATLFAVDAALEDVPLDILAGATVQRMQRVIVEYREARTPERLLRSTGLLVAFTAAAALLLWLVLALLGAVIRLVERRIKGQIERLEQASHWMIHRRQMWAIFGGITRALRLVAVVAIVLTWASTVLGLYPWTRHLAMSIFALVLDPLHQLGSGLLNSIPDIAFLAVLVFVVRLLLRGLHTFFKRVESGWIRLENFEADWAMPTYRIVRVAVIVLALVVAYPYIPGSESQAFKGIGIFMGVILSIGSTSFISNLLAGYSLTYRAAYREGDRVRIGDQSGEVVDIRAMNTRLRTLKNEEINIPNSIVLNSAIVNYSAYARQDGLVLYTEVGIGYDTPWRQVEAMLKMAAERTPGIMREPPAYVLQKRLGDFTVIYELNAHCDNVAQMNQHYSDLHANIQDVFNEYGVQIMSPNYEHDPEQPKLVRPEDFYTAPAKPPAADPSPLA
ncbi:mechanosensitive ion channel family protein [Seongchinamella sediminis]|uniref:Small-conductance mechanosensitive channel n=1 Tax=Seongchinamella sediminis TaxID=2283635 RepID=A0A3L7E108_9GAMM|nr:mechanosensitive ion channel domain-containing protein [Seongchinamella sediminis]RLQ22619.1 mechanosensitive ion channel family protein [Seongchinamella sediminis]